ncbi:hypothetical protein CI109_102409 [Kwoniella shandongensis]|uniref:Histidinol-phosphatase n=1 Tax=Kwoniella shandongensis TaxID=1734106 RepID=A0A5M6C3C8_9TREE|nr:uncharacterized protein CI109_003272 [Kwoniella shandongensis]KAA5528372.1 hypothetical protein CI109_003272 [Kwoniella shandongensis]
MPHSHHSHSGQFCRHAKDNLEDVILEAIRQGFEVFGLSEHAPRYRIEDLFPEEADLTPSDLLATYHSFLTTASSLRTKYSSKIQLLISLETDYITPLDSLNLSSLLSPPDQDGVTIDYIVGSVHHVRGISIDFDRSTWLRSVHQCQSPEREDGRTMDPGPPPRLEVGDQTIPALAEGYSPTDTELIPFLEKYFDSQYDLISKHQPEVLGHVDLCLLWTPEVGKKLRDLPSVWEKVERNVKAVIAYGGLFEANAAAFRKGWETSYPSRDILDLIISLNGRICLSDDSHGVSYVGLNYLKLRDYLINAGVETIWYLLPTSERKEGDEQVGNRGRVIARESKGWDEHPFWKKLEVAQTATLKS